MHTPDHDASLPLDAAMRVDAVCLAFEASWRAGASPRPEDFLTAPDGPERTALLLELLRLDLHDRGSRYEAPNLAEYLKRFPRDEAAVRAAFQGFKEKQPAAQ